MGRGGKSARKSARGSRGALAGRVLMTRAVVHVTDVSKDPEHRLPTATTVGFRTVLGVPMLQEGSAIGVILVARDRVAPFTNSHIALLQTFAHQAVIAIENVHLFTELKQKNEALTQAHAQVTDALEQQTATSEILRVISSSPGDIQPVAKTIAANAARLCDADDAHIFRRDGDMVRRVVRYGTLPTSRSGCLPAEAGLVHGASHPRGQDVSP